jgi:hypothetical protein
MKYFTRSDVIENFQDNRNTFIILNIYFKNKKAKISFFFFYRVINTNN